MEALEHNWKQSDLPALQRQVVDRQLAALRGGQLDPVFRAFGEALAAIPLEKFCLFDAACASGYYAEVLRALDRRPITYRGADFSPDMIALAKRHYPCDAFEIQDLTRILHADRAFEVVMAAAVLEHVPRYAKALDELTRVTAEFLILHRTPCQPGEEHEFTVIPQYTIASARIFFSRAKLVAELRDRGFTLVKEIEVYPLGVWRHWARRLLGRHRTVVTLVFRRG